MLFGFIILFLINQDKTKLVNTKSSRVNVVAAENFLGNITSQIGGDYVSVTSIITDPSADPHLYESDAHDALAISNANIIIVNGLGYDNFMDKLLLASPNSNRSILKVEQVLNVTSDNTNPHLWYNTNRIAEVGLAIKNQLSIKDPQDEQFFTANLNKFIDSLKPILNTINQIKIKYPNAPVGYTERVPGYLLTNTNLNVVSPLGFASAIEEGNDPSPADTNAFEALISNHKIKVLIYNSQASSQATKHIRDLAEQSNIPVIGVTETLPLNEPNYQTWQLDQVNLLLTALGG